MVTSLKCKTLEQFQNTVKELHQSDDIDNQSFDEFVNRNINFMNYSDLDSDSKARLLSITRKITHQLSESEVSPKIREISAHLFANASEEFAISDPELETVIKTNKYNTLDIILNIESGKSCLIDFFENVDDAIDFAIKHKLKHVDLIHYKSSIDDTHITRLVTGNPKIEFLSIESSMISDDSVNNISTQLNNLKSLDLIYCTGLTDNIRSYLVNLPELKSLKISYCRITNRIGNSFKDLSKLEELNLSGCNITDKIGENLKNLPNLHKLNLENCSQLTDKIGEDLEALTNLTDLDLTGCNFTDSNKIGSHLAKLKKLNSLKLRSCSINDEFGPHLEQLTNLTFLDLSASEITDGIGASLESLVHLTTLEISQCMNLTNVIGQHLEKLIKLRSLNLSMVSFLDDSIGQNLKNLKNLESINFSYCEDISPAICSDLSELDNLTTLNFHGCEKFGENMNTEIVKLNDQVEHLNLFGTEINNDTIACLQKFKKLKTLDIAGNKNLTEVILNDLLIFNHLSELCVEGTDIEEKHCVNFLIEIAKNNPSRAKKIADSLYIRFEKIESHLLLLKIDDHEKRALYLSYLEDAEPSEYASIIANLEKLSDEGKLEIFCKHIKPSDKALALLSGSFAELEPSFFFLNGASNLLKTDENHAIDLLKTSKGKEFIIENFNNFSEDSRLENLLFKAYPPDQEENFPLYFNAKLTESGTLLIEVFTTLPLKYPHLILDQLTGHLDQVYRIIVNYKGSRGMDEGGLRKQFVSQWFHGIVHTPDKYSQSERKDGFLPKLSQLDKITEEEKRNYQEIGKLFGFSYITQCQTGPFYSPGIFHAIKSFSKNDLDLESLTPETFFKDKDNDVLLNFLELYVDQKDEFVINSFKQTKIIFQSNNETEVKEAIQELLPLLGIDENSRPEIISDLREYWIVSMKSSFALIHQMAKGMESMLPFNEMTSWEDLNFISTHELSKTVQGEVSPESFKASLIFSSEYEQIGGVSDEQRLLDQQKCEKIHGWLNNWIDKADIKQLENLLTAITGAPVVPKEIKCDLTPHLNGYLFLHTCFNRIDIFRDITEEQFISELNSYGTGKGMTHTAL